ncbi:MAG: hypothetical protein ABW095_11435 [Candidatus Thiodiazotropha sp.]
MNLKYPLIHTTLSSLLTLVSVNLNADELYATAMADIMGNALTTVDLVDLARFAERNGLSDETTLQTQAEHNEQLLNTLSEGVSVQLALQNDMANALCEIDNRNHRLCPQQINKIVFVSSQYRYGSMLGVPGADLFCNIRAHAAGHPGSFKAWISSSPSTAPEVSFSRSMDAYVLPDGTLVAHDWSDLTDGQLSHSINQDEFGNTVAADIVWTATNSHGKHIKPYIIEGSPSQDCMNWTSAEPLTTSNPPVGIYGASNKAGTEWSFAYESVSNVPGFSFPSNFGLAGCNTPARLYCFQQ